MAKKEIYTAEYISNGADARLKAEAQELTKQLFFMREKLEALRVELKDEPLITEYDNGGQQRGTHVNPAYKAHRELLITYTKTLKALEELIGKKDPGEKDDYITELRNRYSLNTEKATGTEGDKSYWKK